MKYLILFNSRNREIIISKLIIYELHQRDKNASVFLTFWAEETNNFRRILEFAPDVLLTFPFTIPDLIEEVSLIKCATGCRVCTLTTEGYASEKEIRELFMGFYDYPRDLIDEYLFFGEGYRKTYVDAQKKLDRYGDKAISQVVGYPMYEFDKINELTDSRVIINSITEKKKRYRKTITILTGFGGVDNTKKQIRIANDSYNANAKNKNELIDGVYNELRRNAEYRDAYRELIRYVAEQNKEFLFIIKAHPKEMERNKYAFDSLANLDNVVIIKDTIAVYEFIRISDCMIHYGSTACAEAYILEVPSILIEGYIGDIIPSDYVVKVDERETLCEIIKSKMVLKDELKRRRMIELFFGYNKDQNFEPSSRIAEELNRLGRREHIEYNEYVDNGYYAKLIRAYLLMALKQLMLMNVRKAKEYLEIRKKIRMYRSKYI